jgi:branched-subunit amino acid aminotransferase/4-amino-4-deoxychorismate lyase
MPLAFTDGRFVDKTELAIHPTDYGFARGIGVFEATRVYGGKPFRLTDHVERFQGGADLFGITCPSSDSEIIEAVQKIIGTNQYKNSLIKFYLTAGECASQTGAGFGSAAGFTPHLIILEDDVPKLHPDAPRGVEAHHKGIALKSVPFTRQHPSVKSVNYSLGYVAAREWFAKGWDEVLFTHNGIIAETTMSNFFVVIDGVLCTPANIMLLGVTRKVILELARDSGIPIAERDITLHEMDYASECFITGSVTEMIAVHKLDNYLFKATDGGPVYKQLRGAFTKLIETTFFV